MTALAAAPKPEPIKSSNAGVSSTDLQFELRAMEKRLQEQFSQLVMGMALKLNETQAPTATSKRNPVSSVNGGTQGFSPFEVSGPTSAVKPPEDAFLVTAFPELDKDGFTAAAVGLSQSSTGAGVGSSTGTSDDVFLHFPSTLPDANQVTAGSDDEWDLEEQSASTNSSSPRKVKRRVKRQVTVKPKAAQRPSVEMLGGTGKTSE